jgi:hypothetical protein
MNELLYLLYGQTPVVYLHHSLTDFPRYVINNEVNHANLGTIAKF